MQHVRRVTGLVRIGPAEVRLWDFRSIVAVERRDGYAGRLEALLGEVLQAVGRERAGAFASTDAVIAASGEPERDTTHRSERNPPHVLHPEMVSRSSRQIKRPMRRSRHLVVSAVPELQSFRSYGQQKVFLSASSRLWNGLTQPSYFATFSFSSKVPPS